MLFIVIDWAGNSSYQAKYSTCPLIDNWSVPHWIRVESFCPPMPIHTDEYVSFVEFVTAGTTHEPLTLVTVG